MLSKFNKDISLIFSINLTQHQKYLMNDLLYRHFGIAFAVDLYIKKAPKCEILDIYIFKLFY